MCLKVVPIDRYFAAVGDSRNSIQIGSGRLYCGEIGLYPAVERQAE